MERKSMNRKLMIWMVVPVLVTFLTGCPKKKPATPPTDLPVETEVVETPPPATTQEVAETPTTTPVDATEDPLLSADLQVVNDELRRRGFSPDVFFDYDEISLSDENRKSTRLNSSH